MRFTTAAVVTGLAAVAAADNGWGNNGWGNEAWSSSSAVESSSAAVTSAASASSASAASTTASNVWVTDVVTAFTTYCPFATEITHKGSTYSVTEATTLTITNCPGGCTITRPVSTSEAWSTPVVVPSKPATSAAWVSPKPSVGTSAPWKPSANGTATGVWSTGSGSWSTPSPSVSITPSKGDASKTTFGVAGLIAAVGLIAAL